MTGYKADSIHYIFQFTSYSGRNEREGGLEGEWRCQMIHVKLNMCVNPIQENTAKLGYCLFTPLDSHYFCL